MDKQCSSCGGFCKKSGCERENVQPEQKPVAWADRFDISRDGHDFWVSRQKPAKDGMPLYTAPPKKEWVSLTDAEYTEMWGGTEKPFILNFFHKIEEALKEKNND